ncbi:hypothetical protein AM588_10010045 [Phytophthora nicotianae]|uniref:Uncharacterized protein n=1 Tax=Phytophthora nicotianae TaxID=4792 RepID=A0A0W8DI74_PHYNI|nr:hypothetical protein AM588_10010045 [Phytophthora nicotianae]
MFNYNKISALCLAVVTFSGGAHAKEEAAQTFGLLGAGLYGGAGAGVGAGLYGNRAGWYGPGAGVGVGAGAGVGGVGAGVGGGAAANANAGATASANANANANAGAMSQYRKLRSE